MDVLQHEPASGARRDDPQQPGQQAPGAALDLDLGERCQIQEHRPARQRLAEHRDGEKSRGTREQERTGRRVGIHGELDGPHEVVAAALDLVHLANDHSPHPLPVTLAS